MKLRIHPILLPVFLFLIVTGNLSTYAIIFLSLLIHEAGHAFAAWTAGMRIRSCTIMPYGGELVIPGQRTARKNERIRVALGGPVATAIVLFAALILSFPGDDLAVRIQLALLALNLLPLRLPIRLPPAAAASAVGMDTVSVASVIHSVVPVVVGMDASDPGASSGSNRHRKSASIHMGFR